MQRPAPISPLPREGMLPGSSSPCLWSTGILKERSINLRRPAFPYSSRSAPEIKAQSRTRGSPTPRFPGLGRSDTGEDTPGAEQDLSAPNATEVPEPRHRQQQWSPCLALLWGRTPKGSHIPLFSIPQ